MFTRDELDKLLSNGKNFNLSIFLTTGSENRDLQKGRIQLKNLLKESEAKLLEAGIKKTELSHFTHNIESLLEDSMFWSHLDKGLAIFATEEDFYFYTLPVEFEPIAVVKDHFYIKPLFPTFQRNGQFYVLAISQNKLRLLYCTKDDVTEVKLNDVPTSLAEALKYDDLGNKMQLNTRTSGNAGGQSSVAYHGHGAGMEEDKTNILRYFQEVNAGLVKYFNNDSIPLILAGVAYLFPIYKEANKYRSLLEQGITGNPEEASNKELQQQGWTIMEPYLKKEEIEIKEKYNDLKSTGKASNDLSSIVSSAYNQRVEVLFIAKGQHVWGRFDKKKNELKHYHEQNEDSEDILDFTAFHTFTNGGKVYVMEKEEMPCEGAIAAIYRY
ncbi:baeRF7 domain-containing protein [Alkaliphilus metalliredigens]|nr:hypothetical protein [Alkaliphilus metalliredigens]